MRPLLRALGILSILEMISILGLLANLLTVHDERVVGALGPVHGALYLAVAVTALMGRNLALRTRAFAVIPLFSGPLTALRVREEAKRA